MARNKKPKTYWMPFCGTPSTRLHHQETKASLYSLEIVMHNKYERIDGISPAADAAAVACFFFRVWQKIQVTKSNQNKIVPLMVSIDGAVVVFLSVCGAVIACPSSISITLVQVPFDKSSCHGNARSIQPIRLLGFSSNTHFSRSFSRIARKKNVSHLDADWVPVNEDFMTNRK